MNVCNRQSAHLQTHLVVLLGLSGSSSSRRCRSNPKKKLYELRQRLGFVKRRTKGRSMIDGAVFVLLCLHFERLFFLPCFASKHTVSNAHRYPCQLGRGGCLPCDRAIRTLDQIDNSYLVMALLLWINYSTSLTHLSRLCSLQMGASIMITLCMSTAFDFVLCNRTLLLTSLDNPSLESTFSASATSIPLVSHLCSKLSMWSRVLVHEFLSIF